LNMLYNALKFRRKQIGANENYLMKTSYNLK